MRIAAVGVRLGQLQSQNLKWVHSHASSGSCFNEISTALFQNISYRQGDATTVKPQGAYSSLMPEASWITVAIPSWWGCATSI